MYMEKKCAQELSVEELTLQVIENIQLAIHRANQLSELRLKHKLSNSSVNSIIRELNELQKVMSRKSQMSCAK